MTGPFSIWIYLMQQNVFIIKRCFVLNNIKVAQKKEGVNTFFLFLPVKRPGYFSWGTITASAAGFGRPHPLDDSDVIPDLQPYGLWGRKD